MVFFLEDDPDLLRDITRAASDADSHRLELLAHRMKGLAKSFDDGDLEQAARKLESLGAAESVAADRTSCDRSRRVGSVDSAIHPTRAGSAAWR